MKNWETKMSPLKKRPLKVSNLLGVTALTFVMTSNSWAVAAAVQQAHPAQHITEGMHPVDSHPVQNFSEHQTVNWKDGLLNNQRASNMQLSHVLLVGDQTAPETIPEKEVNVKKTAVKQTEKADQAEPTVKDRTQCVGVINDNFKRWIKLAGGTGDQITLPEIGKLLENPDMTPKEAAALSALTHYIYDLEGEHDTHPVSGLSLKQIVQAIEHPSSNGSDSKAATQLVSNYLTAYENVRQDTHKDGWSLWGDNDPPILSENVQWKLNDCYLVSAVNGLIRNDPDALKKIIKQTGPDTFKVTFPGYDKPLDIKLTPGEVAAFSYSRHGGCYLAVIGMAVVKVMEETGTDKNPAAAQTPLGPLTDTHTFGWVQKNTFHLLTGKEFVQIHLDKYSTTQWKQFIENALNNSELIGTDYAQDQHFLTIIGLKDVGGQLSVVIKNPWGNSRPFEGHKGKFGVFTIPLADMVSTKFGSITIQKSNFDKVTMAQDGSTARSADISTPVSVQQTTPKVSTDSAVKGGNSSVQSGDGDSSATSSVSSGTSSEDVVETTMQQGSLFVANKKKVRVISSNGNIEIAPKAVAYIVQIDKDVAIYNIRSEHNQGVQMILPNKRAVTVPVGHELLLTANADADFDKSNLRPNIHCKNVKSRENLDGVTAFDAEYSVMEVLDDAPGFEALVNSQDHAQQRLAEQILKEAVIVGMTQTN